MKASCTCNLTFYALVTSHLMEAEKLCKSRSRSYIVEIYRRKLQLWIFLFSSLLSCFIIISGWYDDALNNLNSWNFSVLWIEMLLKPKPHLPALKIRAIYHFHWIMFQCRKGGEAWRPNMNLLSGNKAYFSFESALHPPCVQLLLTKNQRGIPGTE